jgi:threonine dehydratase
VERTRGFGAEIVLHGDSLDEARNHALQLAQQQGLVFVHPYDDPDIVAGQGTVALEMLAEVPDLDTLVIAVGGGGLIAGMATAARAIRPDIEIIGVQTTRFPGMFNAIKECHLPIGSSSIAEGIAVASPGLLPQGIVRRLVNDLVLVDEGDIEQAIVLLLEVEKNAGRRRWCRRTGSLAELPGPFQGQESGPGTLWWQHRPPAAGGHY